MKIDDWFKILCETWIFLKNMRRLRMYTVKTYTRLFEHKAPKKYVSR